MAILWLALSLRLGDYFEPKNFRDVLFDVRFRSNRRVRLDE